MEKAFSINLLRIGTLSAFLLLAFRVSHVVSFHDIYHVVTSGFEEESLFALWKYLHVMPVYNDPHQLPYSASYFNWLFYSFYGTFISLIFNHFHLDDAFLPTIGRCITLMVVGLGFLINKKLLAYRFDASPALSHSLALSLSGLLWLGPLVGYWAITVRPDILALFFDVCAAFLLFKYIHHKTWIYIFGVAIGCYLSWACKQVNITMPIAIGFFLLTEKEWKAFALFSMVLMSGYALTLILASEAHLKTLFFIDTAVPFSSSVLIENVKDFAKKTIPVSILLVALIGALWNKQIFSKIRHDKMVKFSLCGCLSWGMTLLPASSKVGSSINYYFIALFFLLLGIGGALRQTANEKSKWMEAGMVLAGIAFIGSIFAALTSDSIKNIQQQQLAQISLKKCMDSAIQPIFVINPYAALPWMNPSPLPFVLAYNYWNDRRAHRRFEHNGIGGLIEQGYFNTLILPAWVSNTFDEASLNAYELGENTCGDYAVFIKKEHV